MNIPKDLRYTATHEWVRTNDDGTVTVGITDHAQEALGDMVYVELPEVGRVVAAAEACAVVESVKAASDVYAPVAGKIAAVNAELPATPEALNADAYAAWLFRITPDDPNAAGKLLDAAAYEATIGEE